LSPASRLSPVTSAAASIEHLGAGLCAAHKSTNASYSGSGEHRGAGLCAAHNFFPQMRPQFPGLVVTLCNIFVVAHRPAPLGTRLTAAGPVIGIVAIGVVDARHKLLGLLQTIYAPHILARENHIRVKASYRSSGEPRAPTAAGWAQQLKIMRRA